MEIFRATFRYIASPFLRDPQENQALNGVRAFAILLVTMFHSWIPLSAVSQIFPGPVRTLLGNVNSGVDLFFVLSGYLIYSGLLKWHNQPDQISKGRFLLRRVLRIFPAYYFYLIVSVIFYQSRLNHLSAAAEMSPGNLAEIQALTASLSHWYADFFFISNFTDHKLSLISWSLAIEQQFYLILPFLAQLFLFRFPFRIRVAVLCALSGAALAFRIYYEAMGYYQTYLYFTQCRMDSLAAGMILAELEGHDRRSGRSWTLSGRWQITSLAAAAAILYLGHAFTLDHWFRRVFAYNCYILGYAVVLYVAVLDNGWFREFLASALWRPIARMSYTMYLWNITTIGLAANKVIKHARDFTAADFLLVFLAGTAYCFVTAWVLHLAVEKPFLALKNHFRSS
ncbi:MAG: acyltransferase [Spirochaetia bacterium]|nr:acyltransferase [Spirochaetia bacterium]